MSYSARLILLLIVAFSTFAQTPPAEPAAQPHPLTVALQQNRLTVTLSEGKLSGAGAELLVRELASTQFFFIGEEHGTAEMARMSTALLPIAWKHGYRHVAVEAGALIVERLANESRGGNAFAVIEAFNRRYPWALPFFSWREEAEYLAKALELGGHRPGTVWGIDQEFLFPVAHLERLVALAKNDTARNAAQALLERARASEAEMVKTKKPNALLMLNATAADFDPLRTAFRGGDAEALRIIDALDESRAIYGLHQTSGWESNERRVTLIKRLFVDAYASAVARGEARPKVFAKLGATHVMRGRSMVGVFDLGTTIPEIATMNGTRSFQLLVLPSGGFVNAHRPFSADGSDKRQAYDLKAMPFDAAPLMAAAPAGEWSLFDLRPLRRQLGARKFEPLETRFRNVLWGFDAVLIIPEVTPATLFE